MLMRHCFDLQKRRNFILYSTDVRPIKCQSILSVLQRLEQKFSFLPREEMSYNRLWRCKGIPVNFLSCTQIPGGLVAAPGSNDLSIIQLIQSFELVGRL